MGGTTWDRVRRGTAIVLGVSATLLIAGQVLAIVDLSGATARERFELISQIANPGIGLLVLGAALCATLGPGDLGGDHLESGELDDLESEEADVDNAFVDDGMAGVPGWVMIGVLVLGALITIAAVVSIINIITIDIPSPGETGQEIQLRFSQDEDWTQRVATILVRAGGGVLGAWAAWIVLEPVGFRPKAADEPGVVSG